VPIDGAPGSGVGPDYPATLNSRRNLASAYRADGRTREAEALLESVLANYERTPGHDHPYTKTARENLSGLKRAAKVHRPNRQRGNAEA
jgi:hypothetical protein